MNWIVFVTNNFSKVKWKLYTFTYSNKKLQCRVLHEEFCYVNFYTSWLLYWFSRIHRKVNRSEIMRRNQQLQQAMSLPLILYTHSLTHPLMLVNRQPESFSSCCRTPFFCFVKYTFPFLMWSIASTQRGNTKNRTAWSISPGKILTGALQKPMFHLSHPQFPRLQGQYSEFQDQRFV